MSFENVEEVVICVLSNGIVRPGFHCDTTALNVYHTKTCLGKRKLSAKKVPAVLYSRPKEGVWFLLSSWVSLITVCSANPYITCPKYIGIFDKSFQGCELFQP